MSYIYPHSNPEILELGFGSMALYREKKPEPYAIDADRLDDGKYMGNIRKDRNEGLEKI